MNIVSEVHCALSGNFVCKPKQTFFHKETCFSSSWQEMLGILISVMLLPTPWKWPHPFLFNFHPVTAPGVQQVLLALKGYGLCHVSLVAMLEQVFIGYPHISHSLLLAILPFQHENLWYYLITTCR